MNANQLKRKWIQIKGELKHQWGTFADTVNYLHYQRRVKTCSRSQGTRTSLSAKPRNSMAKKPIPAKLPTLQVLEQVELARGIELPTCGLQRPQQANCADDKTTLESVGTNDQPAS